MVRAIALFVALMLMAKKPEPWEKGGGGGICSSCSGRGSKKEPKVDKNGETTYVTSDCSACRGTGKSR